MFLKDEKNKTNYYQQLTTANPLQKKTLRKALSIFPLIQLPTFQYSDEHENLSNDQVRSSSPDKLTFRTRSLSPKKGLKLKPNQKLFELEEKQLKKLFQRPLYTFNKRLSRGSNNNFANIKVFPQQSHQHPYLLDNIQKFYLNDQSQQNLQFQSRFESGNLAFVSKSQISKQNYYLLLTKDLNTARCTQWFFFRVLNKQKGKVTFHILNLFKNYSSFQQGMKICVSTKTNNYTWIRAGSNIQYRLTNIKADQRNMYCLSFDYQFQHNNDASYFSYCLPYTYSQLDRLLFQLEQKHVQIMKRKSICTTLGGNSLDMLTITNFKQPLQNKKVILITARVHPGQTPSSFVMQGIINKLLQNSQEADILRTNFVFKLVPMLNPDGVINGNYRCSLSGNDLNRIWNIQDKDRFPEIYGLKKSIRYSKKPFLYIDLHAHSKKKGVFMYGCNQKNNPYICRQIPFILWRKVPQFNYYQCNFSISKSREGTGRINMYKQMGIQLSYTMQHSFCGPLKTKKHFNRQSFISIGQKVITYVARYFSRKNNPNNQNNDQNLQDLYNNKDFIKVGQGEALDSEDDSQLDVEFQVEIQSTDKKQKLEENQRPMSKLQLKKTCANLAKNKDKMPSQILTARTSLMRQKSISQVKISNKRSPWQLIPISKVGLSIDQLKRSAEYQDQPGEIYCQTFIYDKRQDGNFLKSLNRYSQQEVNNLTNLFLPSVTSSSYKKYNKQKVPIKGVVQVGLKYLENAGLIKDQIKSVNKRKIEWKNPVKNFL